jgi:hypothetical protein
MAPRARATIAEEDDMRRFAAAMAALLFLISGPSLATASEQWCDGDPLVTIQTPGGNLVPVYVTSSAPGNEHLPSVLSARISYHADAVSAGTATLVRMEVLVPDDLSGAQFSTRTAASSGPLRTGALWATASGQSGQAMQMVFTLNVP